jgi:hypothetical protein
MTSQDDTMCWLAERVLPASYQVRTPEVDLTATRFGFARHLK